MAYLEILQKHNADLGGLIDKANSLPEKGDLGKQLDALIEKSITEVKSGATKIGGSALSACSKLKSADFPNATSIGSNAFNGCFIITSIILRSETVCTLSNTNAFNGCYHIHGQYNASYNPNMDKDGYIYVPSALVESYQSATNWSTFSTQFRALEDYTVDGTITGALDPNKI